MSHETSVGTGKPYGLQRVCLALNFPRASIYAERARAKATVVPIARLKRGPKPKVSDAVLLEAIRADLANSPFTGEGHRKVWARLRILHDIRASRARVLRLMREHHLLSPHRKPQGEPNLHDGRITTDTPNEMWGTEPTGCASRRWTTEWSGSSLQSIIAMDSALASTRRNSATASPPWSLSLRGCKANSARLLPELARD